MAERAPIIRFPSCVPVMYRCAAVHRYRSASLPRKFARLQHLCFFAFSPPRALLASFLPCSQLRVVAQRSRSRPPVPRAIRTYVVEM